MFIIFASLNVKAIPKMNNKEIQEQRMKGYFMQATKELLKGEGLKSLNVRNIAQQAGYSFATLYNYFKDVKELVFLCVDDFQKECTAEISQKVNGIPCGPAKIKAITKAYMAYFVQYPSVFNLFFIEKLGDIGQKQPTANLIYTFLERLTAEEWGFCQKEFNLQENEIAKAKAELNYVTAGMLLFYMNRIQPVSYKEFAQAIDIQIDAIVDRIEINKV
ncbi:MAG: TetR/AcrR family transcriptional regulator [Bacteroidales bacterium]